MPDGVFNVVHGDKVAVDALLEHPDVAAVSFVGSTPIARYIYETATTNGKRVPGARRGEEPHDRAARRRHRHGRRRGGVSAAYGSAGERCMAISMVVAVGDVADPLIEAIKERIPKVKVGDGIDAGVGDGPARHARAPRQGRVVRRARRRARARPSSSTAARARPRATASSSASSLIDNVTPTMDNYRDEIFGPVLGVTRVDTYDEAIKLVNENPYGNGTAIFTRDGGVARQFQFDVQAGMVGINVPIPVPVAYYSFGGWKAVALRRPAHLRAGGDRLLHAREGRHLALARPGHVEGRPRLPADARRRGASPSLSSSGDESARRA